MLGEQRRYQIFSYFEFTVLVKNVPFLDELDRILFRNNCKFRIVYTDVIIDLDNYNESITQYLNEAFIQFDNYLLFVFEDDNEGIINLLYSRYEEYILYKGFERLKNKPDN